MGWNFRMIILIDRVNIWVPTKRRQILYRLLIKKIGMQIRQSMLMELKELVKRMDRKYQQTSQKLNLVMRTL